MCGLFGMAGRSAIRPPSARRALDCVAHRGPDDEGYLLYDARARTATSAAGRWTDRSLALPPIDSFDRPFDVLLAHRRLSILDTSAAAHQPMPDATARRWIVFNGEIYNFVELREELRREGETFRTTSDTEVLLAAYSRWGAGMLTRLVGMFALAILDGERNHLFIARDPFGIKPLYWRRVGDAFAFASEIKPLLGMGNGPPSADVESLYQYLRFGLTDGLGDSTMFDDVRQLPAAHYMFVGLDGSVAQPPTRYWTPGSLPPYRGSFADATAELRLLLDESVRLHLRSDVPLGACLSGGLDSTILVASMRAQLGPTAPIHAFSFESSDPVRGEGPYVQMAADALQLIRHSTSPSGDNLVADLDALIKTQEQPFDSTSIYAQYCVFRLAREHGVTVVLDGQGSDELFGGYQTAVSARLASSLIAGDLAAAVSLARSPHFTAHGAHRRVVLSALGRLLPPRLAAAFMSLVGEPLYPQWVDSGWFKRQGQRAQQRLQGRGRNSLHEELQHFVRVLSLPRLLRYEDRNSMAFSIESRVPYCTVPIADFALSLPASYLVAGNGETKTVLRHAARGRVPARIIDRPKIGFETPEHDWLNVMRPWVDSVVRSESFRALPFLAHRAAERTIVTQLEERRALRPATWRMLNVAVWSRYFDVAFPS